MKRAVAAALFIGSVLFPAFAGAQSAKGGPPPDPGVPATIAAFTKGVTAQTGLFPIWRKSGKIAPAPGTPYDAQSLAREKLRSLSGDLAKAKKLPRLDLLTRAHVDSLAAIVDDALTTRSVVPVSAALC